MRASPLAVLAVLTVAAIAPAPLNPPPTPPPPVPTSPTEDGKLPDIVRLRLGTSKFREANYIQAASLSPDGKLIAVGNGQTIRFLEVATGKEDHRIGIREYLQTQQIIWSSDGKQIITTGYNGINIWDAKDGRLIKQATSPNKYGRNGIILVSDDPKFD